MNSNGLFYHGSKSDFDRFDQKGNGKHGFGFYFTPDKNEAIIFAKTLAGDVSNGKGIVYSVNLSTSNLFNTMSIEHCSIVSHQYGFVYKAPEFAGGAKEHYHHLTSQMKKRGFIEGAGGVNDAIQDSGFDGVYYDLMEHVIVFSPDKIELVSKDPLK